MMGRARSEWLLLVVAFVAGPTARAGEQEQAIAAIKRLGGKVEVDEKVAGKPVVTVYLWVKGVTDKDLKHLRAFPSIEHLSLGDFQVTDEGLKLLRELPRLESLYLQRTRITDAGLAHLKDCKNLSALWLRGTKVTDAGLAFLEDCMNLTELDLSGTSITDEGLVHLKDHKKLTRLDLDDTPVTDAGLAHLAELKGLTILTLSGTKVSERGLAHLKGMPLNVLWIHNTGITDLTPLQGMPLEQICLTPKNISKGLDILRDMKSLKTIGISSEQTWPATDFWDRYRKGEFGKAPD